MRHHQRTAACLGALAATVLALTLRPPPWGTWRPERRATPHPNGYWAFDAACRLSQDRLPPPPDPPGGGWVSRGSGTPAPANRDLPPDQIVRRNREAIAQLRAALALPCVRPDLPWELDPPTGQHKRMVRVLLVCSRWHAAHGDPAEAMRCRLDAAQVAVIFPRGGWEDTVREGEVCERSARREVAPLVDALDGPTAAASARRLEGIVAGRLSLVERARQQRRWFLAFARSWLARQSLHDLCEPVGCLGEDQRGPDVLWLQCLLHGGKRGIWRSYERFFDDQVKAAELGTEPSQWPRPGDYGPMLSVGERFTCLDFETGRNETGAQFWLAALALRAYQVDHGAYPATLAELVPRYLRAVPRNVANHCDLNYRRDGGSYVLWTAPRPETSSAPQRWQPIAKDWNDQSEGSVVWGVTRL